MTSEGSAPAIIASHVFVPRGEWWTTCLLCGLAEAAHLESSLCPACGEEVVEAGEEICWRCDRDARP